MQTKEVNNIVKLEVKNLEHTYAPRTPFEFKAITNISTSFEPGKFYAIIGKTGSGKSTFIQHLNALLKPTNGSVHIDNKVIDKNTKKIKEVKEIRKKVGLVFQFPEYQLFETTVLKDVMFGPTKLGQTKEEATESSKKALKAVRLPEEYWEKSPFELSGGQKRRVAIAGILSINTDVIIFDEPTAGLDPKGEKDINNLIVSLKEAGKCVIVVTHNLTHVLEHADEVVIMNDKTIKFEKPKKELFANPQIINNMELAIPTQTLLIEALKEKGFNFNSECTNFEELVKQIKNNF